MLADQCNMLAACGVDIPKGTLPPIVYHHPSNFVGETLEVRTRHDAHNQQTLYLKLVV